MNMASKKELTTKMRKKSWFKIIAPRLFRNQVIGESLVNSPERLIGKTVKISLSNLTGDIKRQGTVIKFLVTRATGEGGQTDIMGYEILPATLKRFMRRGVKTIANSFECITADNVKVRVKPMIFAKNEAKGGISRILNKTAKISLIKTIKSISYIDLLNDIISSRLQKDLKDKLNKLFPVRMLEIKALEKISGEGKKETAEEETAAEKPEEKEETEEAKEE